MPWRGPNYPGEFPSLGPAILEWIGENLIVPDGPGAGQPLWFTEEQAAFVIRLYAIDPTWTGPALQGGALRNGRTVRRAVLSRPKGWGKSPLVAALCITEALADVVPDGWDADGEPVARPWHSLGFKPKTQVVAVSEDQTANTWEPILEMCREGPVARHYAIDALETFVSVPNGRIDFTTSSARSREGFRLVFAAMDQTESWVPSIGGPKLASTIRRNLTKTSGCSIETPNAFIDGEGSVAEASHKAATLQLEGKLKHDTGILLDHREAPPDTDPSDEQSLRAGLAIAYGDSRWVDLNRVVKDYYDPDTEPSDARRFFLNQVWSAGDAWLTAPEWRGCLDVEKVVGDREPITLGFDGSRKRAKGVTDATALIGCRVSDGHLFELRVWEQPTGPAGVDWEVPTDEVLAEVDQVFARRNVVGFYCDPAMWETHVAAWEAKYHKRLKVKATQQHPCHWWMTGGRSVLIVRALLQFHSAVVDRELTHDGASALTRHILAARNVKGRNGSGIAKEHPDSARKIDAAVAAVLAFQARHDAIATGIGVKKTAGFSPRRIR